MVEVKWLGHACFELKGKKKTIIIDPFKGTGLPEPDVKADIILCTHSHADHNNAKPVMKKDSVVLESFTGIKKMDDITVKGVATFHDDTGGGARGRNSIYVINMEDLTFCHIGDLGHDLADSQIAEIGKVDVLFIPVGGYFTIDAMMADKIADKIKPIITVPMHYRIDGMASLFDAISGVDKFLTGKSNVKKLEDSTFSVEKASLPSEPVIIVPRLR